MSNSRFRVPEGRTMDDRCAGTMDERPAAVGGGKARGRKSEVGRQKLGNRKEKMGNRRNEGGRKTEHRRSDG